MTNILPGNQPELDPIIISEQDAPTVSYELTVDTEDVSAELTLRDKLGKIAIAFKNDWNASDKRGKTIQVAALAGQVVERSRVSEWAVAPTAVHVLQNTNSPVLTGLSVLGMVGAMQAPISITWAKAMHEAEGTFAAINENFPKVSELAEDIGPAKERHWYSGVREGASSFLTYGTTPFVVAEKLYNPDITESQSVGTAIKMTGKCAVFGYAVGHGVGEVIQHVSPETAHTIMDWAGRPVLWLGLAMSYEAPRFIKNRLSRRKARKAGITLDTEDKSEAE